MVTRHNTESPTEWNGGTYWQAGFRHLERGQANGQRHTKNDEKSHILDRGTEIADPKTLYGCRSDKNREHARHHRKLSPTLNTGPLRAVNC